MTTRHTRSSSTARPRKPREAVTVRPEPAEVDRVRSADLFDLAPVAYLLVGGRGEILEANVAAAQLLGMARGALENRLLSLFVAEGDLAAYSDCRARLVDSGEPQVCELRLVREDGTTFWARLSANGVRDTGGTPSYRVVLADITGAMQGDATLRESERRAQRQRAAIARLVAEAFVSRGGLDAAAREVTRTAAQVLQAARASVWLLADGDRRLECIALYEAATDSHSRGTVLQAADYPRYFDAIQRESRIVADDARTDPLTSEFARDYLLPLGITSMLDAGISIEGRLRGVVCVEHVGPSRHWHPDEEAFAGSVSALVAQVMAEEACQRAEEALRDGRELLSQYIRHSPIYAYIKEVKPGESRVLFVSDNYDQMLGIPAAAMVGRTMADLFPADLAASMTADDWTVVADGQVLTRYEELGDRSYTSIKFPITVGGRRLLAGYTIDITDRQRTEDALRESREMLHRVLDTVPQTIFWKDAEGRYLGCNRVFAHTVGLDDPDRVVGRTDFDLTWTRADAEAYRADDREVLASGRPKRHILEQIQRSDGTRIWGDVTKLPLFDRGGRPFAVLGVYDDITERKLADEARAEAEARIRSWFELPLVGLCLTSPAKQWLEVNDHLCTMLGYGRAELATMTWAELTHPDDLDADVRQFDRVMRGEIEGYTLEKRFVRKDGTLLPTNLAVRCVRKEGGAVDYFVALIQDNTEHRRAEEEQAKLEARLQQAQRMESVGRLAGGVAHDFNNMLSVILGHVDMAMDQVDPHLGVYEDLKEIRKATERSADLTRQLLAFARRQTVAPKVLDLNETVGGMLKMLGRLIGEGITLQWNPGPDVWPVRVDPSQVDQVLANLCVNARDAIAGVGRITIQTDNCTFDDAYCAMHPGSAAGHYVRLTVSDTGCGMDPDTLQHVFEPFFTTKGVGKGTGLGLATVYGIVEQNNGFVTVDSAPGRGTTFTIHLPRFVGETGPGGTGGVHPRSSRGHETILLVEDEPAILKMTAILLQRQGYTVLAARTPGEAIRLAREHGGQIDLLLTDVVMPEMNGRDLARNILASNPHVKRLFTSGYTADVIAHHGVLDEGVMFIQKPFTRETLAAKVREALDRP